MKRFIKLVLGVLLAVSLIAGTAVSYGAISNSRIASTKVSTSNVVLPPDWWLDANLHNGLWYSDVAAPIVLNGQEVSFMKIYSVGANYMRVMELSTYPRAYKDTSPHIYTVDTAFTVTNADLNDNYWLERVNLGIYHARSGIAEGTWIFVDTRKDVFLLGETAHHWAGDPLPGSFPLWVESEALQTPKWVDQKTTVFPAVFQAVKGQLATYTMYEAYYRQDTDTTWTKMPDTYFQQLVTAFSGNDPQVKLNAKIGRDRLIVRVIYQRLISP